MFLYISNDDDPNFQPSAREKETGCGFLQGVGAGRESFPSHHSSRPTTFIIPGYKHEETYTKAKVKEVEAMQHLYM